MPILVRKINMAKWMQNDILSGNDVSADAITNCMRTNQNALSTWQVNNENEIKEAVLAIVASHQHLDTIDIVFLDHDYLKKIGINLRSTPGDTPVKELINNHIDICELTYNSLGVIAKNIVQAIKDDKKKRVTKRELKTILSQAIESGRLVENDLHDSIRTKLRS